MVSRRVFQSPLLRQIGRAVSNPPITTSSFIRTRTNPFHQQSRSLRRLRDDGPAYEYDPHKHQNARPLFTPKLQRDARRSGVILFIVGTGGTIFYLSNIEETPVTGRKRFNCYSAESVKEQGDQLYKIILDEYGDRILPAYDPRCKQVQRVLNRLLPVSGMPDGGWELHVIDEPKERNAFVIPGNKVFVYSGILPICRTEDGLAAVLGHEIAHNLASHSAERMSQTILLQTALYLLMAFDVTGLFGQVLGRFAIDYGVMRPASRVQESEADYIGLLMMTRACYDPNAAISLWQRMKATEETSKSIPEFMSTHPSNANRISRIQQWLPEAETIRDQTDCAVSARYIGDFVRKMGREFVDGERFM